MRLTKGDCDANNILKDILQGTRMKVLLQRRFKLHTYGYVVSIINLKVIPVTLYDCYI